MTLAAGSRLGPYEILDPIGAGGMGEVYRARDTKLERDVAVKVLPKEFANDEERLARFEREAKLLASLNHPNIASIHGLEESDGVKALVLELVEGPTLAERIARGPIPVDETVAIAKQIAEALEAGHEAGVIHRDLKPANIKLKEDGTVKVLDYGLAKALESDATSSRDSGLSNSPTLTRQGTHIGVILGTAAYMSPEQAKGKRVDRRTDIWAFGAVVYEMLTGARAFSGEDVSDTLAAVLRATPKFDALPDDTPPALRRVVELCLTKDPRGRVQAIGDVRLAMEGAFQTAASALPDESAPRTASSRIAALFAALFLAAAGVAGWALLRPEPPLPVARFGSLFRDAQAPIGAFELTPDGSALIYVGPGPSGGGSQLWMRRWDGLDARPIPATEGVGTRLGRGAQIGISPDGREVAFVVGNRGPLRVTPLAGGPSRALAEKAAGSASWSTDGWIYFGSETGGISRIRSTGGEPEILTELREGELFHDVPQPLPDGRALLFNVRIPRGGPGGPDYEVWSLDLETSQRRSLTPGFRPRYAEGGYLLFGTSDGLLMAAPFDATRVALEGAAVPVAEGLANHSVRGDLTYSVSENGSLVYLAEGGQEVEFVWVARSGQVTAVHSGETFYLSEGNPGWRLSPDGGKVAFARSSDGNQDIWVKELPDGPVSRLSFGETRSFLPQWAPDGRSITYVKHPELRSRRADGTGAFELLFDAIPVAKGFWSPDGEWLVLRRSGLGAAFARGRDILAIRPGDDREAIPLVATEEFVEDGPALSRDGRWLAYSSNETGRDEIFVRPFPDVDAGKWQVSTGGGICPVWAHNGRELFFVSPESRELRSAAFRTTSTTFEPARVTTLFELPRNIFLGSSGDEFYDVTTDDERFLMAREAGSPEDGSSSRVVLVQNFFEELKRLVPPE